MNLFQKFGAACCLVVMTMLAVVGCNAEDPSAQPTYAKSLELSSTDVFGQTYTYLGDVEVYAMDPATGFCNETVGGVENGTLVETIASTSPIPSFETLFLNPGEYCVKLIPDDPMCSVSGEPFACSTPPHFENFIGCSFVSVEANPFTVLTASNTPVSLNFIAGYNENVCPTEEEPPFYVDALCGCLVDSLELAACHDLFDSETCEMNVPSNVITSSATFTPEFTPSEVCSETEATQCTEDESCLSIDGAPEACYSECEPAVDCPSPGLVCASVDCAVGEACAAYGMHGDLLSEAVYVCIDAP